MRLRWTVGDIVLFDLVVLEVETEDAPDAVHDLSTGHEIGFSAPPGWREPIDPPVDE